MEMVDSEDARAVCVCAWEEDDGHFDSWDTDSSGALSLTELEMAVAAIQPPSKAKARIGRPALKQLLLLCDSSLDGELQKSEAARMLGIGGFCVK
jgi:hypothetical protein